MKINTLKQNIKKIILAIKVVLFLGLFFGACNQKKQEVSATLTNSPKVKTEHKTKSIEHIKTANFKSACDYNVAAIEVYGSIITICEKYPKKLMHQQITEEDFEYLKLLIQKASELEKEVQKRFSKAELRECTNYKRANRKYSSCMNHLSRKMEERLRKSLR